MRVKPLIKGLLTFVPFSHVVLPKKNADGGSHNAKYCYDVWMKHIVTLWNNGLRSVPNALAEFGPGDSLGIGLSAMLSGVNHYYALDAVKHANLDLNIKLLDELIGMFENREKISIEGPSDIFGLKDDSFPSDIITEESLKRSLHSARISAIRQLLVSSKNIDSANEMGIHYLAPWTSSEITGTVTVDLVLSHSVLEHIDDIESAFDAMNRLLGEGGYCSHLIDLRAHGTDNIENGHWKYSELTWKVIKGKRDYLINRLPYSAYRELSTKNDFEIVCGSSSKHVEFIARVATPPVGSIYG